MGNTLAPTKEQKAWFFIRKETGNIGQQISNGNTT